MTIEQVRQWIAVCYKAGMELPEQIYVLDAYATILETRITQLLCDEALAKSRQEKP